ncbi:hypothetical protein DFH06DRAFT_603370 [Mycena polygramma]|nr:hypothetical protein DFH06DRAFT_603370 [Mycena polygramma]
MDYLLPNHALDASQAQIVRSQLASALDELSELEDTLLKFSLVSAELQRQKNRSIDSVAAMRNALSPVHATPPEILSEVFRMCRDASLASPAYSISDAAQAPLVLTHVSARWRSICLSTSHLWDQFRIRVAQTSILWYPTIVRQLLARSGVLPLQVHLVTLDIAPQSESIRETFTALLQHQGRFQSLHLDLAPSDLPPVIWNQNATFPLLASVRIYVRDTADDNLGDIIRLFATTQCVQTVEIIARYAPATSWLSAFKWSVLTVLNLHIQLDLNTGRQILMQCTRLQKCGITIFYSPADTSMQPPPEICTLGDLWNLNFCVEYDIEDPSLPLFFAAFAFPSLTHLTIDSQFWRTEILPELYDRSPFSLEDLTMTNSDMNLFDIVPFLRLVPSVRTIYLESYGFNDELFAAFSCNANTAISSLTLPHLHSLDLMDLEFDILNLQVTGQAVLMLAESLSPRTGENAAFPALESVNLLLNGPPFDSAIERRLDELSTTSILHYWHEKMPVIPD